MEHPDYDLDVDADQLRGRGTATWSWSAGSTPRRPPCSARVSSASGPACSGRRPRRSAPAGRWPRRTTPSRPTASTASPGAGTSTRSTLLGLYRGVNLGGWDPAEHNFHLYTIVIGAQTLHATGYAMGIQRDGAVGTGDPDRDAAVIAYFGDGATAQGDVNEAFVFASVFNAPVVFFCQNNQWAISEPNERQTRIPLYQRAGGFGFPGVRVDGNDVLAVHAVTRRRSTGPGAVRARPSSRRSPTGWARTPPPTTRRATGSPPRSRSGSSRTRSPGSGCTWPAAGMADEAFFAAGRGRGRRAGRARPHASAWRCPTPSRCRCSTTSTTNAHPLVDEERAWFDTYHRSFAADAEGSRP